MCTLILCNHLKGNCMAVTTQLLICKKLSEVNFFILHCADVCLIALNKYQITKK